MDKKPDVEIDINDLRIRRPATTLIIKLNRCQRDTFQKISKRTGKSMEDIVNEAINEYLKGQWLIRCQTCDYEWAIEEKEMFNPELTGSQCHSVQFWQHIPAEVINYGHKSDKPHF
mgnify:FL=1